MTIQDYDLHQGYDPVADVSYLLRVWEDGTHELMVRPGKEDTRAIWSPEVPLNKLALDGSVAS